MRKLTVFYLVLICSLSVASLSYGLMLSSDEVIEHAKNIDNTEAKTAYLLKQAEIFISKNRYQEAEHLALYVRENFPATEPRALAILARIHPDTATDITPIKMVGAVPAATDMAAKDSVPTAFENWADQGGK